MTMLDPNGGLSPQAADVGAPGLSPRSMLVRKLCDIVVLPAAHISANQRSLASDLLLNVLDKVEEHLRLEVAVRIGRVKESPPALVRMLLRDEPQVAEPIIRGAESIQEALLIECVRDGSTAHRDLVARRFDLTTSVADAILEFDEPDVARLLLRRTEFQLSPRAIDKMVARSATDKELQVLLLKRPELEPAHGFMMFWWVGAEQRKRILARFSLDRAIIQDAVQDLYHRIFRSENGSDPFVRDVLIMLDRRHRPRGTNGEPVSMDVVVRTLRAARRYPAQEIIYAVAMIAGVTRELAARILRDPGGEPFALMCKSLGMPRNEFFQMIQEKGEHVFDEQRAEALLGVFDAMARDFARAVLRYWDWDGNPRIADITRLLGLDDDFA